MSWGTLPCRSCNSPNNLWLKKENQEGVVYIYSPFTVNRSLWPTRSGSLDPVAFFLRSQPEGGGKAPLYRCRTEQGRLLFAEGSRVKLLVNRKEDSQSLYRSVETQSDKDPPFYFSSFFISLFLFFIFIINRRVSTPQRYFKEDYAKLNVGII